MAYIWFKFRSIMMPRQYIQYPWIINICLTSQNLSLSFLCCCQSHGWKHNFQEILLKVVKILLSFGKLDDDAWIIYHTYCTQLFLGAEIKTCFNTKVLLPHDSDGKASACNVGDPGLIPGSGRSPGEGNGNPLQCSCLENSMGRGA